MCIFLVCLVVLCVLLVGVMVQDVLVYDKLVVCGSIIVNLFQDYDNFFLFYFYESNYLFYMWISDFNKEVICSYDWVENVCKDEVKFQLSLVFLLWCGILGDNLLLGVFYIQKFWWQFFNSKELVLFCEINYEFQLFLGFVIDYQFVGWMLCDIEMGYNYDLNGCFDFILCSWNWFYVCLMV